MGIYGQRDHRALRPNSSGTIAADRIENGVCGKCRFAYRPDPAQLYKMGVDRALGKVACGNYKSGYYGSILPDPYGMGCGEWMNRLKNQPGIGDPRVRQEKAFNVDLVKKAQVANAMAKIVERQLRHERIEGGFDKTPEDKANPFKSGIKISRK